jgi:hypothetical protein
MAMTPKEQPVFIKKFAEDISIAYKRVGQTKSMITLKRNQRVINQKYEGPKT